MTFLNPIFLWAAFALAIPLIVHLFNFRRPQRILFSDISLVKEVKRSIVKRIRLKQWLLLAVRMLALLSLVFMFANPVLKDEDTGKNSTGSHSVVIILDNSYSMKTGNENGEFWLQAKSIANEILGAYGETDEFLVMSTGDLKLNFEFSDKEGAEKDIEQLQLQQNLSSLAELYSFQKDFFSAAANANHNIYIISDFQESTMLKAESYPKADSNIQVTLIPLSTRTLTNSFLSGHNMRTQLIEAGSPIAFTLTAKNESKQAQKNLNIRLVQGARTRPITTVDLEPEEALKIEEVMITTDSTGWQSGYWEIDDYPSDFDNKRYFSYYVPDREKTLVVSDEQDIELQLLFSPEIMTASDSKLISFRALAGESLENYQSIILVGLRSISSSMQEKLIRFLESGKSLLLFPGSSADIQSLNRLLEKVKAGRFSDVQQSQKSWLINQADLSHPLFEGMFINKNSNRTFEGASSTMYYPFQSSNQREQNILMRFNNGAAALVETKMQGGFFYLFTFSPSPSSSDFYSQSNGGPLMKQLVRSMNLVQKNSQLQTLGDLKVKRIKANGQDVIKLRKSTGETLIPAQRTADGFIYLDFEQLEGLTEGNYDLIQGNKLLEKISFNLPESESQLKALQPSELSKYLATHNLGPAKVLTSEPKAIAATIQNKRSGTPLWKYFLILAAFFLLSEFFILSIRDRT